MKHLSFTGYTPDELKLYRPAILGNTIQGLIIILRAMVQLDLNFVHAERLMDVREFFADIKM